MCKIPVNNCWLQKKSTASRKCWKNWREPSCTLLDWQAIVLNLDVTYVIFPSSSIKYQTQLNISLRIDSRHEIDRKLDSFFQVQVYTKISILNITYVNQMSGWISCCKLEVHLPFYLEKVAKKRRLLKKKVVKSKLRWHWTQHRFIVCKRSWRRK